MLNKIFASVIVALFTVQCAFSADVWVNDLKKLFTYNSAIIYEVNIRTFGAKDTNKNGIIDFDMGEESGNFVNAISRLDEMAGKGINTLHVMPITPVGKTKALGTAGSLYSASGFNTINPQLVSSKSNLSPKRQAENFIAEAHKRNIRVIIDLPSCGSYDLYLQRPELFVKDKMGQPVIPADWTDVRLLNSGTETAINADVYNVYKEFVDMVISLGADGIRADVATSKPAKFWRDLIEYSHKKDPQFVWLAEASDSWTESVSPSAVFTPYDKLLEAGFDGYYGSYFKMKDMKYGKDLISLINSTNSDLKKFTTEKAVIGSFTTHDEMSPILVNGPKLSNMIIWLNATLPVNSYFVDGFDSGDTYIYMWANKEAFKTFTDDDNYFVHRGKLDIFNFSRQPGGNNTDLVSSFALANFAKRQFIPFINLGKFVPLRTTNPSSFAYAYGYKGQTLVVIGNLDFRTNIEVDISVPKLKKENNLIPITAESYPTLENGKIHSPLNAGEIQVFIFDDFEIK